jgi:predicted DsbA family dithiol-disulfide isomerase
MAFDTKVWEEICAVLKKAQQQLEAKFEADIVLFPDELHPTELQKDAVQEKEVREYAQKLIKLQNDLFAMIKERLPDYRERENTDHDPVSWKMIADALLAFQQQWKAKIAAHPEKTLKEPSKTEILKETEWMIKICDLAENLMQMQNDFIASIRKAANP